MSTADVEDLSAERGGIVSREAIRLWVNRFGPHFANCVRRDRPRPNDKWHLDAVVIPIRGKKRWLWRAIDAGGDVLDSRVQTRRNATAAKRFLQRLIPPFGAPRVVITDKLRRSTQPIKTLPPDADHRAHKGLNNAIAGSHGADPQAREGIRSVHVTPAGSEISVRARSDQPDLPAPPPSTLRNLIPPRPVRRVQPLGGPCHRDASAIQRLQTS